MHVGFWCPNGRHVVQKGDVLELVKKTWLQHRQSPAEDSWVDTSESLSWTLSPYWAAAFCSFALGYLWSANISKIFLAVCWVSTSNCSIHFLISPCDPLLGCWSLITGLEGFITSSAVKNAFGCGTWSERRTQASRPRCVLAFGLAPNAVAESFRFLGAATGGCSSDGSMGSSSGSCEPTAGRLEGVSTSGRDGVRCDFCVWRSFSSVSFNFFCTSCNSRRAWVSCLVGLISFNLETTAWIKGDIKPEGSSDLLGMGASGSVVRWRCSDKVSMSTPWSRIAFSNCDPNTLSAILLVVMIPKNRPSERSLSPNSDAPWRVSNPMRTVSGFRPHMFFLLLQAVGWMVLWNLWPYSNSSSYIVEVDFHSGGVRILGGGTSCDCHVSGCGHVSWPWFHCWSCQLQFFEFHELDHSFDLMENVWRKEGSMGARVLGLVSKWCSQTENCQVVRC